MVLPTNEPDADAATPPPIELVLEARPRDLGGFAVGRLLPSAHRRMVGPFIFLDHMGPVDLAAGGAHDILPHPHIGLSTVTYLLEGENVHRDSLGSVQRVRPGDLNIMTAGRGIVHSERFDPALRAGRFHGVQIWLALPEANEDDAPSFAHHDAAALPEVVPAPGVRGRVLLGAAYGATSPAAHPSEPLLVDLELAAGATLEVPADGAPERGVYVIDGAIRLQATALAADHLAVLQPGAVVRLTADAPSRVLVLGGPSPGRRLIDWNFVASTQDRIDRARAAWQALAFPLIPGDDREYVPLPPWPKPPRA